MKKFIIIAVTVIALVFVVKCTWSNGEIYYTVTAAQPGTAYTEYTTPNGVVRATYSLPFVSAKYVFPTNSYVSLTVSRFTGAGDITLNIVREGSVWKTLTVKDTAAANISGTI